MSEFCLKLYGENDGKELFELSPLYGDRHEIARIIDNIGLTGDIFFRLGNESYCGVSFSHLVAKATYSEFSHAAIGIKQYGRMWVVEQNDRGCTFERIIDHIDYATSGRLYVMRLKNIDDALITRLTDSITQYLEADPDYNFNFELGTGKYYCTQSVVKMYGDAGYTLCKPEMPHDLITPLAAYLVPPINNLFKWATHGQRCLPMNNPVYIVGNKEHGIMSNPELRPVADFRQVGKDTIYDRFLTHRMF